jgi:cytochrome c biogenesis protein
LFLLLLLAIAAVPGSLVPQRGADPNGVVQYFKDNPTLAPILDKFQAFDAYSSFWFSSIYLLLFISLIGCVIPRTVHHFRSLRAQPPRTPARLSRLDVHLVHDVHSAAPGNSGTQITAPVAIAAARTLLRKRGYRVAIYDGPQSRDTMQLSVSAERGYLREAGNLIFHIALVGILIAVGIGGGFGFTGQRVVVEGQTAINTLAAYDSFNPGRFFNSSDLSPYAITLNELAVTYETKNTNARGLPTDYTATVHTRTQGAVTSKTTIKVNEPLNIGGTDVYLLGNGYAPKITVRNAAGRAVFSDYVPFLPQDSNLTSLGVVKVPDGLTKQIGMVGFFYPTKATLKSGALTSSYPDLKNPVLTLNVYSGDLGLNNGIPRSVYALDTSSLTQLTGGTTEVQSIKLSPGGTQSLPNGLGTVTFDGAKRFASFEIHHDPAQGWVLLFAVSALLGLLVSLFIPRRRVWVKATGDAFGPLRLEYAALARGDDPQLHAALADLAREHQSALGIQPDQATDAPDTADTQRKASP